MRPKSSRKQEILSPSEWRVFWVVSQRYPLTIAEIVQELGRLDAARLPVDNTIRTFVARLQKKGYLSLVRGEVLSYRPAVPYQVALRYHVDNFLTQYALNGKGDLDAVCEAAAERLDAP